MLEFTQEQLHRLLQREHSGFVVRVHAEIVRRFPELLAEEGLVQQLQVAHERALGFGLEEAASRTQFLYQAAFAPGFYEQPAIAAWLRRPGASPEQRWRDFMALATARSEQQ